MRRILVIENQIMHYEKIFGYLKIEYDVFPKPEKYREFMDWVRIFININYDDKRNAECHTKILDYLEHTAKMEMVLLDYKLSGSHNGLTGIELMTSLSSRYKDLPFLFLSRTESNSKEVQDKLALLKNYIWVEKGYAGLSLLEGSYFRQHVFEKIPLMLQKRLTDQKKELLTVLIDVDYFDNYKPNLTAFIEKEEFSALEIEFIDALWSAKLKGRNAVDRVFHHYHLLWQ